MFFARLPNNIGLIAGRSAAIRVWYRDSTLSADFYSNYRPRPTSMSPGPDLFFRFDTLRTLVQIHSGPESVAIGMARNPEWIDDHVKLGMLFLKAGQPSFAADQFEKIATVPGQPEAVLYGGACRELAGELARADSLYAIYGGRFGISADSVGRLAAELKRAAPIPATGPGS